ncbi:MAG: RnfABCDGE type electron transport complex subunit B [Burkholderiaceae bacterium]
MNPVDAIDAVLPQTQCRQCGYDGCRPYAAAIAHGEADIDRCPPGGDIGLAKIASVVGRPTKPLDPMRGITKPLSLAVIDEALCIGCTLCIQACPVDAIVGGAKRMHDVVADLCTGCELCLPPCPVDCITMVAADFAWDDLHAAAARTHHDARSARLARFADESTARPVVANRAAPLPASRKQAILDAAIERARLLRQR